MSATRGDQRGFATLASVALIGVLLTATLAAVVGVTLFVDHRRLESAADLAALAGAAGIGAGDACVQAGQTAAANGAELEACELLGRDVRVTVALTRTYAGMRATLRAQARAGPA